MNIEDLSFTVIRVEASDGITFISPEDFIQYPIEERTLWLLKGSLTFHNGSEEVNSLLALKELRLFSTQTLKPKKANIASDTIVD